MAATLCVDATEAHGQDSGVGVRAGLGVASRGGAAGRWAGRELTASSQACFLCVDRRCLAGPLGF